MPCLILKPGPPAKAVAPPVAASNPPFKIEPAACPIPFRMPVAESFTVTRSSSLSVISGYPAYISRCANSDNGSSGTTIPIWFLLPAPRAVYPIRRRRSIPTSRSVQRHRERWRSLIAARRRGNCRRLQLPHPCTQLIDRNFDRAPDCKSQYLEGFILQKRALILIHDEA